MKYQNVRNNNKEDGAVEILKELEKNQSFLNTQRVEQQDKIIYVINKETIRQKHQK